MARTIERHALIALALMVSAGLQVAQFHDWAMAVSLAANVAWLFE